MKKNIIRKALTVVAGAALTMAMGATVFAADVTLDGAQTTDSSTVSIEKNLKVVNPELTSVDGPGLKYTYTVAPEEPSAANGGVTITDANDKSGTVHIGPAGGVTLTTASVEWPVGTAVNASAAGADNIKKIVAETNISAFTAPGIYRYKITEAADPADPSTIGVTDADTAEVRYLDVYIENGADGLVIGGYVLHDGANADGKPTNKKTFDASEFETINVELKKTVSGNMADKNNQFPFAGTVSDHNRYFFDKKGDFPTTADKNDTGSFSTTLAHNEKHYIYGLSTVALMGVTETNNTSDTYTTSVSGIKEVAGSAVAPNGTKGTDSFTAEAGQLVFNNNLDSVSPTGVVMRYGAPILLLLAALAFVVMHRRNRKVMDAE